MTSHDSSTRVDVADLVGRPGASRPVEVLVPPADTLELPLVAIAAPVRVHVLLESLVNGILARGDVTADVELACARCLELSATTVSSAVVELFADPGRADADDLEEGYEIRSVESEPHLDLDILVRDALTEGMPTRSLCQAACKGLCATCGANLNEAACDCAEDDVDERWAALRSLDLPED